MGEIAEMIMEGLLCRICGVYLDDDERPKGVPDAPGYPVACQDCEKHERELEGG